MSATSVSFGSLRPLAIDRDGRNVVIGNPYGVFRIRVADSTVERVAGIAPDARATSFRGRDSCSAIRRGSPSRRPRGTAFSDSGDTRSTRSSRSALVRAVLGTGAEALPAYRNLALASPISTPTGIAFGDNADAFVASASNGFVVRLDAATDTVRQFVPQATVVDGTAVRSIFGIARRPDGRIILADSGNHRVVEFDANGANGIVLAGTAGVPGCTAALLREPRDIAIDPSGDLLVADSGNDRIVRIDAAGSISLAYGWTCDTSDAHLLRIPSGIDIDANDDLYIADTRKSSRPSDRRHRQRVGRGGTKRRSFGRARARRTRC